MPAFVIPNCAEVRLIWELEGVPWAVNVLHYQGVGGNFPGTVANANAIAAFIADKANDNHPTVSFQASLTDNVRLAQVGLRDIGVANQPEVFNDTTPIFTGTNTGDPIPVQTALVATLRTALAGRSYRGRIYWGGFGEGSNTTGGQPTAALATIMQGFTSTLVTLTGIAGGAKLVVASRKLLEAHQVTSVDVDTTWDTQRRRGRSGI